MIDWREAAPRSTGGIYRLHSPVRIRPNTRHVTGISELRMVDEAMQALRHAHDFCQYFACSPCPRRGTNAHVYAALSNAQVQQLRLSSPLAPPSLARGGCTVEQRVTHHVRTCTRDCASPGGRSRAYIRFGHYDTENQSRSRV
jgi:hypothetical protein